MSGTGVTYDDGECQLSCRVPFFQSWFRGISPFHVRVLVHAGRRHDFARCRTDVPVPHSSGNVTHVYDSASLNHCCLFNWICQDDVPRMSRWHRLHATNESTIVSIMNTWRMIKAKFLRILCFKHRGFLPAVLSSALSSPPPLHETSGFTTSSTSTLYQFCCVPERVGKSTSQ